MTDTSKTRSPTDALASQAKDDGTHTFTLVQSQQLLKKPKALSWEVAASYGLASGDVELDAKAVSPDASYYWQWSTDQKNWVSAKETPTTKIAGRTSKVSLQLTMVRTSQNGTMAAVKGRMRPMAALRSDSGRPQAAARV